MRQRHPRLRAQCFVKFFWPCEPKASERVDLGTVNLDVDRSIRLLMLAKQHLDLSLFSPVESRTFRSSRRCLSLSVQSPTCSLRGRAVHLSILQPMFSNAMLVLVEEA